LIASGCFRTSAPTMQNGFIATENCFVSPSGRNNGWKISMNSAATLALERIGLNTGNWPLGPLWPSFYGRGRPSSPADRMNRSPGPADSNQRVQPSACLCVVTPSSTKDRRRG
jgi:hypothetical protein